MGRSLIRSKSGPDIAGIRANQTLPVEEQAGHCLSLHPRSVTGLDEMWMIIFVINKDPSDDEKPKGLVVSSWFMGRGG